jgi:hypothetical protein
MTLDDKGRCCGRKPLVYKRSPAAGEPPQRFCFRCDRAYHLIENRQIANWAYEQTTDGAWKLRERGPVAVGNPETVEEKF